MKKRILTIYSFLVTLTLLVVICFFYKTSSDYNALKSHLLEYSHGNIIQTKNTTLLLIEQWDETNNEGKNILFISLQTSINQAATNYALVRPNKNSSVYIHRLLNIYTQEIYNWRTNLKNSNKTLIIEKLKCLLSDFKMIDNFMKTDIIQLNDNEIISKWENSIIPNLKSKEVLKQYRHLFYNE